MLLVLAAILFASAACSSAPYWNSRRADALDVPTFAVGDGAGVKARVGPLHLGLFANIDSWGLRGGKFSDDWGDVADWDLPMPSLIPMTVSTELPVFGLEVVPSRTSEFAGAAGHLPLIYKLGVFTGPMRSDERKTMVLRLNGEHAFQLYTQMELAVGLWKTARVGGNPGELVDFMLGWLRLDLYGDDRATAEATEAANVSANPFQTP
jgi:hypothetical protein